jgi:hypothetical protein
MSVSVIFSSRVERGADKTVAVTEFDALLQSASMRAILLLISIFDFNSLLIRIRRFPVHAPRPHPLLLPTTPCSLICVQ